MAFLRRRISVQIQLIGDTFDGDNDSLQLDNLRCTCRVQGTQGGSTSYQSQANVRLYGMLPDDAAKLSTLGLTAGTYQKTLIAIYAGDDANGMSQIFSGSIYGAFVDYNAMPDVGIEISASATANLQHAPIAATSFRGSANVATLLQAIANQAGLAFNNAGVQAVLANHAIAGSAERQIAEICQASMTNYDLSNGALTIWPQGGTRDSQIVQLGPDTGLVGYPQYSAQGIDVKCEFNPNALLGRQINVTSSIPKPGPNAPVIPQGSPVIGASGTFWIFDVFHDLSAELPGGPWFTHMKLGTVNTQARAS